jgi:hypothetical protein
MLLMLVVVGAGISSGMCEYSLLLQRLIKWYKKNLHVHMAAGIYVLLPLLRVLGAQILRLCQTKRLRDIHHHDGVRRTTTTAAAAPEKEGAAC